MLRKMLLPSLTLAAGLGWPALAAAQPASPPAAPPKPPAPPPSASVSEVVVPDTYGAVATDIPPERQLSPGEIDTYGVSTIGDLIGALGPETQSIQGAASGSGPALMINGRRVASPAEMMRIPIEAVLRVDILPETVALQYGFGPGQKVVNVVLRPRYAAETGEASGGASTEGGGEQGGAEADLVRTRNEDVTNLNVKYQAAAAITQAQRNVVAVPPAAPFSLPGNVTSTIPGAEIDPALSALAGEPVTIAGVPAAAALGAPTLADFVPTAGAPTVTDTRSDTTLSPSNSTFSASGVFSRPMGRLGELSVSAGLQATSSEGLQGLPGVTLTIPAGDPFSPFASAVALDRYSGAFGPLTQRSDAWSGHVGLGLQGDVGRWSLTLTGLLTYSANSTATDAGIDPAPLQSALDALSASFNPFAPWPSGLVRPLPLNQSSSRSTSLSTSLNANNGALFTLPAGAVFSTLAVTEAAAWQTASSDNAGDIVRASTFQNNTSAQFTLGIPLTSTARKVLPRLGNLSLILSPGLNIVSGYGAAARLNAALSWTPRQPFTLLISQSLVEQPPSVAQLRDPTVLTPNIPYFDYVTGQSALVTTVTGGDPSLRTATLRTTSLQANLRPLPKRILILSAELAINRTDNQIGGLPPVSAQVEAAFPDRFVRGPGGQLIEVDSRPINIERVQQESARFSVFYSQPLGPPPKPSPSPIAPGAGLVPGLLARRAPPQTGGNLQFSLTETIYLQNQELLRPGGPLVDYLNGAPGAVPRSDLRAQAGVTLHHLGAHIDADWKSGYFAEGASGSASILRFSSLATVNLLLQAQLGQMPTLVQKWPILSGTRVEATVTNLFDERPKIVDGEGVTPPVYQPAFRDPLGRVVTLKLRKLF